MANTDHHNCIYCYREKPGRFTKRKDAAGGGWSQPGNQPAWACYDCLPYGQGRGEETMIKAAPVTQLVSAKREGLSILQPLQSAVAGLAIIDTPEDYQEASTILNRVIAARKVWAAKMTPILGPFENIIKEAKNGMKAAKALDDEIDKPLAQLELNMRSSMKVFKLTELRQIQDAQAAKDAEDSRIQRELDEANRRILAARTAPQRQKLAEKIEELTTQQVEIQASVPEPVRAEDSGSRKAKKPKVTDLHAFLKGIIDGYVPEDAVSINTALLHRAFKADPEGMEAWPGVTIEDDVTIVAR